MAKEGDEDEYGEKDEAAEELQAAGWDTRKQPLTAAIAAQVLKWGRGTVTPTVEMIDLRNGGDDALKMGDGKGGTITWAAAMVRLRSAVSTGSLNTLVSAF